MGKHACTRIPCAPDWRHLWGLCGDDIFNESCFCTLFSGLQAFPLLSRTGILLGFTFFLSNIPLVHILSLFVWLIPWPDFAHSVSGFWTWLSFLLSCFTFSSSNSLLLARLFHCFSWVSSRCCPFSYSLHVFTAFVT